MRIRLKNEYCFQSSAENRAVYEKQKINVSKYAGKLLKDIWIKIQKKEYKLIKLRMNEIKQLLKI